ncbi:MepB family protein [Arcticibacter sp.]|uniref:MepB family protein n=1 Tax=Arcticibacter sp. TaxID=1872630 RepID=UPI00388DE465
MLSAKSKRFLMARPVPCWGRYSMQKILSVNGQGGKRGFRVYPKRDLPENKQARQTQSWQVSYFTDQQLLPMLITCYIANIGFKFIPQ